MSHRLISLVGFVLVLQAAAVALAWLAAGAIELNTDTSAPISQLQLLRDGSVASLGELRLARIPSFVRPIQKALVDKLRSFDNRCSRKGNLR
jgi:hypothetical protein